ncbi:MAG: thermonuclease family protein [Granulosicoccus sp.]
MLLQAIVLSPAAALTTVPGCLQDAPKQSGTVERVSDGDTIVLRDRRRIRLIGVNTLELNARFAPDKRWAEIATQRLEALIGSKPITLAIGHDEFDRHGRTLAHLVLNDGSIAAHKLIQQGLGLAVTVGANTRCFEVFHTAETQAREARIGIWQTPGKWQNNKAVLSHRDRGFQLITSVVTSVELKKNKLQMTLKNGLAVKFDKHWSGIKNSTVESVRDLVGRKVELRGWVGGSAGKPVVTLSHPANLKILSH